MANIQHADLSPIHIHAPHSWVVANEAARLALAVDTDDLRKHAYQSDTKAEWMLVGVGPAVWQEVAGAGGGGGDFSGDYNDLTNKPTLGTAAAKNVATSGNAGTGEVVLGNDGRLSDARDTSAARITDATATGRAVLAAANPAAGRSVLGAGTSNFSGAYDDLTGKPTLGTVAGLAIDTDGTLAANSDTRVPSQKAVKTYADQIIAAADVMVFKGVIDASANPNYPAADAGWSYRISVAGKIGGASGVAVEAGDILLCLVDGSAAGTQAAAGSRWNITQTNIDGAVIGPASAADGDMAVFDGTSGKLLKSGGTLATGVRAVVLTGLSTASAAVVTAADSVLSAAGKLQAQISAIWTALSGGTTGQVLTKNSGTDRDFAWLTPAGGAASDFLSPLTSAEIAVTTTATLTISRAHVASGTTADYTVTLPAAAGNTGKLVMLRVAPGCTRWITLKGNASELIDGANTRAMWKGESATLLCDGAGWAKVAGKTIPVSVAMRRTTVFAVASGAWLYVPMPTVVSDNTSTMAVPAADTTNGRITAPRTGTYLCASFLSLDGVSTTDSVGMGLAVNAVSPQDNPNCWSWATTRTSGYTSSSAPMPVVAGQYINAIMYQGTGSNKNTGSVGTAYPSLAVLEQPTW